MKNKILNFFKSHPKQISLFVFLIIAIPTISHAIFGDKSIAAYFVQAINYLVSLIKDIAIQILTVAAYIFDNFIAISLSKHFYDADWVKLSWGMLRDLANIAFIFGIIMIGFFMILGKSQWKKMLLNLIIIVFIMNFSMFFARVIIDAGNFTTAIFYSMASVPAKGDHFDLSNNLLNQQEPFFGNRETAGNLTGYLNLSDTKGEAAFADFFKREHAKGQTKDVDLAKYGALLIVNIITIIAALIFAFTLFRVSFVFLTRTILIIKWIILSPFYFAWYFLPGGQNKLYEWFKEVATKAFCATGFMIGLWLLMMFIATTNKMNIMDADSFTNILINLIVKLIILYKALNYLSDVAIKQCADGSQLGSGLAKTFKTGATFLAGGFALKGAQMLGATAARGAIGKTGQFIGKRANKLHDSSSSSLRYLGRLGQRAENKLYSGVKIDGKSFQDEVARSTKEDSQINAGLTEERRKKRFYEIQGGKNIVYKDGTSEKKNEKLKEGRKEIAETAKKLRAEGVPREDIQKKIKELKSQKEDEVGQKYERGSQIDKAVNQSFNIDRKATKEQIGGGGLVPAMALGGGLGGPMGMALAAGAVGIKNLAVAENAEAARQYKEKQDIISEFNQSRGTLKEELKKERKDYNKEIRGIIEKKSKNLNDVKSIENKLKGPDAGQALVKIIKLMDSNRDGKLDTMDPKKIKEMEHYADSGEEDKLINFLKENQMSFADDMRGIVDKIADPNKDRIEDLLNIEKAKASDIAEIAKTNAKEKFDAINERNAKEVKKLDVQRKESEEDLMLGRERRHNTADNIVNSADEAGGI